MTSSVTGSTSSISGLASGMDTSSIITQLMQIESQPQTLLKTKLATVQTRAAAYRDINTSFAALQTAAAGLTGTNLQAGRSASVTGTNATATAGATASVGNSVSFTVDSLASAQTVLSQTAYTSATDPLGAQEPKFPLTVLDANGVSKGSITLPANGSLTDAAAAINASGLGLSATIVRLGPTNFHLQVSGSSTGLANTFTLQSSTETSTTAGGAFTTTVGASDAVLTLQGSNGLQATSSTNSFSSLLTGVSVTVNAVTPVGGSPTSIAVSADNTGATSKVQALVTAANNVLSKISQYTDSSSGSQAALKGDWSINSLSGQILDAVTNAVGGKSAATFGLAVDRYGAMTFDSGVFSAAANSNPAGIAAVFGGANGDGSDGVPGTADDVVATDGIGSRLMQLAARASDSTIGTLTSLAKGQDSQATDIQGQIDSWTLRLQLRQKTLTDQFNAMETALGTLKNQSSWLTQQLNSLTATKSS
jgi:flagellar hook-associated protein 2